MHTLQSGISAYFDSFAGLVPVKVLSILRDHSGHTAEVRVTRTVKAYKKGDVFTSETRWIVPSRAIRRRRYSTVILPYAVQADQAHKE